MSIGDDSFKGKVIYFFESWFIALILILFVLFSLINSCLDISSTYQDFIEITIGKVLHNLKGSLLSIAAIFIGIYVTVFTLLGSIKVDSVFAYLNENTFKKLVVYIRNAFIASFAYLVLIMILEVIYDDFSEINYWLIVLNTTIVIYMFLTAFRFGVILYISFSKDLDNLQDNIRLHRKEKRKNEELQYRIECFLNDVEKKNEEEHNIKMSRIINDDKKTDN